MKECSDIGLLLNEKTCELTVIRSDDSEYDSIVDSFRKVCSNISLLPLSELELFESPLRPVAANITEKKLAELRRFCSKVQHLKSHDGYYSLKSCFSLSKLMYLLRTHFFENKPFLEKNETALKGMSRTNLQYQIRR